MRLIPETLKRGFEALLTPVVGRLIAARVNPNSITTVGTALLVAAGVAFGYGMARLGGGLLLASGVADMLDGRVARGRGGASAFGAFYDSTLDRVGEAALLGGIVISFMQGGVPDQWRVIAVSLALTALGAGLIVSYTRARAEGLGLECKVGIAQRAERILGIGVPTLFFGTGPNGYLLLAIVALLALINAVTVLQRIVHVYRETRQVEPLMRDTRPAARDTQARRVAPELAEYLGKERNR